MNPHDHNDRIAQRDPCMCSAYGCNQLGTMSISTVGTAEWWCYLHFGKDAVKLQAITTEIKRREWLSQSIVDLRRHYGTEAWPNTFKFVQHEMAMNQRNDLRYGDDDANVWAWIQRLERELEAMIGETFTNPPKQMPIQ